jgi:hypothetical protein
MDYQKMTIIVTDTFGNKRCLTVDRKAKLIEIVSIQREGYAFMHGDSILGPELYNADLDQIGINPGSELEVITRFNGGILIK